MDIVVYKEILITKQSIRTWLVRCGYCNGSGKKYRNDSTLCPICDGAGHCFLNLHPDSNVDDGWDLLRCGYCKGSGHKYSNDSAICPVCKGVGTILKCFPRIVCGYCKGTGHKYSNDSTICPGKSCSGTGSVWIGKIKSF